MFYMYVCTCKALNRYTSIKLNSFTANAHDYGNVENRTNLLHHILQTIFVLPNVWLQSRLGGDFLEMRLWTSFSFDFTSCHFIFTINTLNL